MSCSGAASGPVTLTINDGGSAVLVMDLSLALGVPYVLALPEDGIEAASGDAASVTVSAGAASCVAKLTVGYNDMTN